MHYERARSDYDRMGEKDNINLVKISGAKRAGPVASSSASISLCLPGADIGRTVDLLVQKTCHEVWSWIYMHRPLKFRWWDQSACHCTLVSLFFFFKYLSLENFFCFGQSERAFGRCGGFFCLMTTDRIFCRQCIFHFFICIVCYRWEDGHDHVAVRIMDVGFSSMKKPRTKSLSDSLLNMNKAISYWFT